MKTWKELRYVLYLLELKKNNTKRWVARIQVSINEKKRMLKAKSDGVFVPKYIYEDGSEMEMSKHSAMINVNLESLT